MAKYKPDAIMLVRAGDHYYPLRLASMELLPARFSTEAEFDAWLIERNARPRHAPLRVITQEQLRYSIPALPRSHAKS